MPVTINARQSTTIILHGKLADLLGQTVEISAPPDCSIAELRAHIAAEHPDAAEAMLSSRVRACIGDTLVPDSYRIIPHECVEFLPPVSGG